MAYLIDLHMNIVAFSLVAIFSLGGVLTLDYLLVDYFWGESPSNGIIMLVSLAVVYMVWAGVITYFSQLIQSNFIRPELSASSGVTSRWT